MNSLYCFLSLIHAVSLCFYLLSLSIHSHSVAHKVRCGVYPASCCCTPPALLPSCASFRSVSLYLDHPPTSIFSFSHCISRGLFFSFSPPTSSLTPYFHLPNRCLLSLSCLLLTLFIAYTVSPLRASSSLLFSHHFLFSLPLSFSIPGTAFLSHPFIPTFFTPPLSSHPPSL